MPGTIIRRNERSWAIELISLINSIAESNDLMIKKAGGESTISTDSNTMFPDVILYGNREQSVILQGWELKMPDVPIEDETFIKDAQRKARALNLNSCLIWNFTYAVLYIRDDNDHFEKVKQWSDTNYIHTRDDVQTYRTDWEELLKSVILEVNDYFVSGQFRQSLIADVISNSAIVAIVQRNKAIVASKLRDESHRDARLSAYIDNWWDDIRKEYEHDETDPYQAYSKTVILNWTNRIIFAHIIKHRQIGARPIDDIGFESTPSDANATFEAITRRSDFFNVFMPVKYDEVIPLMTWHDLVEFSLFLKDSGIEMLDQSVLQNILEGSVDSTKRVFNGQFTTPEELAKILTRVTVLNWEDDLLDCCCGTGSIPKVAISFKKERLGARRAVESVWACDKYKYPLQVANISMTSADTINIPSRLFQHNALTLRVGETIQIVNPEDGAIMSVQFPAMGTIVSNLPFVEFERIPGDDKDAFAQLIERYQMDGRSDLYSYIAVKIADVLKENGRLGIIVSNSWLGTAAGSLFIEALKRRYIIEQVHISGKGRWFKNADIVTTILILQKKARDNTQPTNFFLWRKTLDELSDNPEVENKLVNSALLGQELDDSVVEMSSYTAEQINRLLSFNLSYNALFHKVEWIENFRGKIIPINTAYRVFRGSRRGWDAMFYPANGEHHIEPEYLQRVLINARGVNSLVTRATNDAFCCSDTIDELTRNGKTGTLEWIAKFQDQRNGVGKPLPEVLRRANMQWYEMQTTEVAELFTMMNPDQRLFFAMFEDGPAFVNQRLIGLQHKQGYNDEELNHALLNSVFTMFCIEASGFGRGLGVLDINKDSIAKCYMFDPNQLTTDQRNDIVAAFQHIKARPIARVADELNLPDRQRFEETVFNAFGVGAELENVKQSLSSMQQARAAVHNR